MKQVKRVQIPTEDFDMVELFQNAFSFFRHYGKLLLTVALVGMLAGLFRFWGTPDLYSSSLLLQPTLLSAPEQIALINNWSALLKKKEWPALARLFRLDVSTLKKLKSIKTEELQKSYDPKNYGAYTLTVLVTDTAILQPLQRSIKYALDNSEHIKDKLVFKRNNLQSMIESIQQEITRLSTLQAAVESSLQQHSNTGGQLLLNVSDISGQIAGLKEKQLNFKEALSFTSAVYVLQNFYNPSKPTYPQLIKQLLMGLAGGLLLGSVIAFYLHIQRKTNVNRQ
ncbi:hypothetical protein [Longitalea luteola]|uniref:hypothetical protein n=1 Tax=Longitalea luteola TaxID=2812563 RepID=UPI001A966DD2|nr:hypothetical protein [Longitalea luteola]